MATSRVSSTQDGLITTLQLRAIGLSDQAISRWAKSGRLNRLHRGVYSVGHTALTVRAVRRAALLAIGRGASLCLWSSASHQGMQRWEPDVVHVAVASGRVASRPGIVVHHLHSLRSGDVTVVDGLRCTTASRTLVDLAGRRECRNLRVLCEQAEFLGLLDVAGIEALIDRMGYPPGSKHLRDILAVAALGTSDADSKYERRVLRAMLDAPIDRPAFQQPLDLPGVGLVRPDFYWPEHGLVVEADGPHHKRPLQRAKDRARDEAFAAIGIAVIRLPQEKFDADPNAQMAIVIAAM